MRRWDHRKHPTRANREFRVWNSRFANSQAQIRESRIQFQGIRESRIQFREFAIREFREFAIREFRGLAIRRFLAAPSLSRGAPKSKASAGRVLHVHTQTDRDRPAAGPGAFQVQPRWHTGSHRRRPAGMQVGCARLGHEQAGRVETPRHAASLTPAVRAGCSPAGGA